MTDWDNYYEISGTTSSGTYVNWDALYYAEPKSRVPKIDENGNVIGGQ